MFRHKGTPNTTPPQRGSADLLTVLAQACALGPTDTARVVEVMERSGARADRAIVSLGLAPEADVGQALAQHLDLPFATAPDLHRLPRAPATLLSPDFRQRKGFEALEDGDTLIIAVTDPLDSDLIASIGFHTGRTPAVAVITPATLEALGTDTPEEPKTTTTRVAKQDVETLRDMATDGPVAAFVDQILTRAVEDGASDIHLEAEADTLTIRLRRHGALAIHRQETGLEPEAIATRIKVLAGLNVSERRRPQDGAIGRAVRGRHVDFRVSTLPTRWGENIVIRVLDRTAQVLELEALGFDAQAVAQIKGILDQPHGLFLVTGPTGSGKTTTLYAALAYLNDPSRKIVTVEDPIEFELRGVSQTQVAPGVGLDFATALRAILRQDPNVIMIGEIRDAETAAIACRAALVGRLVLSTLHVNRPEEASVRLQDLGVEPYIVEAVLRGALGQELVPVDGGRALRWVCENF